MGQSGAPAPFGAHVRNLVRVGHHAQVRIVESYLGDAGQKRRSADKESAVCKFCEGEIPVNAIRCKHCSEIVNDEYYRQRAGFDGGHAQDVFSLLFDEHVDHVVNSHKPNDAAVLFDHWHGKQVVLSDLLRNQFLIVLHIHR